MKITKRQLKRIIREEYSQLKRKGLIRETGRMTSIEKDPLLAQAYEEGFEQGRHDAIEQMGEAEVMRHMFDSQEIYNAFVDGYEDGYYG